MDLCASFFTLLTSVVEVDGTRMSRGSSYDHVRLSRMAHSPPTMDFSRQVNLRNRRRRSGALRSCHLSGLVQCKNQINIYCSFPNTEFTPLVT